jgi:hypothetical protein
MKISRQLSPPPMCSPLLWATFGLCVLAQIVCANEQPTNALNKVEVPQSVFADDADAGRDPFFPRSGRRVASRPTPAFAPSPQNPVPTHFSQFKLMGISGTASRRIALINNRTFEAGEEAEIKTLDGKVRIRCLEVKENSVVVLVGGSQRKEIFLGETTNPLGPSASAKL